MRIKTILLFYITDNMKYYESHYEEYIHAVEKYNIHPELKETYAKFPKRLSQLENLIIYGPSGVGKYSQVLYLLKKYSPSELKYDKKIVATTEKQQYAYRISDIHYEIDMSLLGCNSKLVWHEAFNQIVDIISVKQDKIGVIVCKNFHMIHSELLEIFYSYMQQYNHGQSPIRIKFFLIMEHIGFLPTTILNTSHVLSMKRPSKEVYEMLTIINLSPLDEGDNKRPFTQRISDCKIKSPVKDISKIKNIFSDIESNGIINTKEIRSFTLIDDAEQVPKDVFNIVCDNVIEEILSPKKIVFTKFRDTLYDILTYNLDVTECLWYILSQFIKTNYLDKDRISQILVETFPFLKHYNNNYRPIYHLESIMFCIINKIHKYEAI